MANIIITSTPLTVTFNFGNYSLDTIIYSKSSLIVSNASSYVKISPPNSYDYAISFDGSVNTMQVDSVDGITPTSNQDLFNRLSIILSANEYYIKQHAPYTLTNTVNVQQLFYAPSIPNGRFTLPVGSYQIECYIHLSSMSSTSGNSSFSLVGTATLANIKMTTFGYDAAPVTASGNANLQTTSTTAFAASMQSAGAGTSQVSYVVGTFEVSVAGTVIPSIALVTAAAAVNNIGSFIKIKRLGNETDVYAGAVD